MLGQHAGDVVVHHHHLVHFAFKLHGKNTHGGRTAAHAHASLFDAVDDRRFAGLDQDLSAAVNRQLHRFFVAQRSHHFNGDAAFFFAAAGQVMHAAQRQHLRAVFGCRDMADHLALATDIGLFGAEKAVGVDLHFQTAVAENAFGHHRDHVHPARLRRHNKGRWFVVGVGGGRADAGDENLVAQHQIIRPAGLCRMAY